MALLEHLKTWLRDQVGERGEPILKDLEDELRRDAMARDLETRRHLAHERDELIQMRDQELVALREAEVAAQEEVTRCRAALQQAEVTAFDAAQAVTRAGHDGRLNRIEQRLLAGADPRLHYFRRELFALGEEVRKSLKLWDEGRLFGSKELNPPQPRSNAAEIAAAQTALRSAREAAGAMMVEPLDAPALVKEITAVISDLAPVLDEVDPLLADRLRAWGRLFLTAEGPIPTEAP